MANRHVKTINGKKYYYQSVRKGKKVTSIYLGPVEKVDKTEEAVQSGEEVSKVNEESAETENKEKEEAHDEDLEMPDDHYIA